MLVAFKSHRDPVKLAFALNVKILASVHHDFGDALITQQRFQRAKAQNFGNDLFEEPLALGPGQDDILFVEDRLVQILDCFADLGSAGHIH